MEKSTFDFWENVQDNYFAKAEELLNKDPSMLNYQLQGYGTVPLPPPYYKAMVRVYYFPEHYRVMSSRLYPMLCLGDTILHICAREGFAESIKWLLRMKIDTTLTNDRNKTAYDVATNEMKKLFEEYYSGESSISFEKPISNIPTEELLPEHEQERWQLIEEILSQDPTTEISLDFFENWPLHQSLKAAKLLRQSRVSALEQCQQAFNLKLKLLKQYQSNVNALRDKRTSTTKKIQELKMNLSQAEKQLQIFEVEEFRIQRENDALKAEYAVESERLAKLQKNKDNVIQITSPLMNEWKEWVLWCKNQKIEELTTYDIVVLLRVLEIDFDIKEFVKEQINGNSISQALESPQTFMFLFRDILKIYNEESLKLLQDQFDRMKKGQGIQVLEDINQEKEKSKTNNDFEENQRHSKRTKLSIPQEFYCKITKVIMVDPVLATDGYSYERAAIVKWLQENDVSPVTGMVLPSKDVFPNISLHQMILSWRKENGFL